MRIVFFGTSSFAVPALKALLDSRHDLLAVVTQPDRKKGRSLKLSPPAVKVLAAARNIPVYQTADASARRSIEYLKSFGAELFVVISFGQILKQEVLAIPKFYSINLHGSLLPKYRGAAPTNWAIINGERSSGLTVIKMNEKMDEGDIILKREFKIDDEDTNITLSEKLSHFGPGVLSEAIDMIEKKGGVVDLAKQDESQATYAPKLKKEDGLIKWSAPAADIHNRVRGLIPWPGAYTYYNGKILKVLKTEISGSQERASCEKTSAGEVIDIVKNGGVVVNTGSGRLIIKYVQLEGKIAMDAASFMRGHRLMTGNRFDEIIKRRDGRGG